MKESSAQRTVTLIHLRRDLAEALESHSDLIPLAFLMAMRRTLTEVFVLLAEREQTPLTTLFVFADEITKEFTAQGDAEEAEMLRLELHRIIAQWIERDDARESRLSPRQRAMSNNHFASQMGMRVIH